MRGPTTALAVFAALVLTCSGIATAGTARAAELADVGGWATLGSVTPGAGCWVDASVEVRRENFAVSAVDVGVNLVYGGEVVSADYGSTNGDGLAFLGVDTSGAPAGADAWLDVLVGGQYAGGMPMTITDGGGCADNPDMVAIGASVPLAGSADTVSASSSAPHPADDAVMVWVPTYVQQRNLSCEYASLVIAMAAYGVSVSEYDFDGLVGWSENPHWGYRGDITGWWGDVFYGAGDASTLTSRLDAGTPVLVWIGLWGNTGYYEYAADGTPYKLAAGQHVVVAYGYDEGGVYVSDPASGSKTFYDWSTFMSYWNVLDGMSLAVGPL